MLSPYIKYNALSPFSQALKYAALSLRYYPALFYMAI